MAVCYVDDFDTTLDAALGSSDTRITLPAADVVRLRDALVSDTANAFYNDSGNTHFVPLVVEDNGTLYTLRAVKRYSNTLFDIARDTSFTAPSGATVRCAPLSQYASLGGDVVGLMPGSTQPRLTPGARVVYNGTATTIDVELQFFNDSFPTSSMLKNDTMAAVMQINNKSGVARTITIANSPTLIWAGGSPQLSIASTVKIAVYTFRLIFPTGDRATLGHLMAKAEFYS